jgi:cyclase
VSSTLRDAPAVAAPRLEEIDAGVYAYIQPDGSWWINNTGLLVGRRGATSIDSCSTERRTRAYLEKIGSLTNQPVRTLINTHHHGDHTYGNYLFPSATIVGHERCREEALAAGFLNVDGLFEQPAWGELELAPPFLTFTEGVDLWVDDMRCEVRYAGTPAHTTNDAVVWLPERQVLFAGDLLFNGGTPFLISGSLSGALTAVEGLKTYGARVIVPGHGDVCGPEVIDDVLGYLRFLDMTAREAHAAGLSPLDAALETDLGQFAELLDPERRSRRSGCARRPDPW